MKHYDNARKIGTQYSHESLIIYDAGTTVSVSREHYAPQWCKDHGMKPEYTVRAGLELFTVWTGTKMNDYGKPYALATAIPS